MRRFSAHNIFTGTGTVLVKGIITLTDQGVVADIFDTHGEPEEKAGVEFYSGVITPGFVNTPAIWNYLIYVLLFPKRPDYQFS